MSLKREYAEASTSSDEVAAVEVKKPKWEERIDMLKIEDLPDLCKEIILKNWCMDNLEAFETYYEVCDAAKRIPPAARDELKNKWAMMHAEKRIEGHLKVVHKHLVSYFFFVYTFLKKLACKCTFFFYFLTASN